MPRPKSRDRGAISAAARFHMLERAAMAASKRHSIRPAWSCEMQGGTHRLSDTLVSHPPLSSGPNAVTGAASAASAVSQAMDTKFQAISQFHDLLKNEPSSQAVIAFLPQILLLIREDHEALRIAILDVLEDACCRLSLPPDAKHAAIGSTIEVLLFLISMENVKLVQRSIQCFSRMYPMLFQKVATTLPNQTLWAYITSLRTSAQQQIINPNEGVRVYVIKLLGVIAQVHSFQDKLYPINLEDVSLDIVPESHPFFKTLELAKDSEIAINILKSILANSAATGVMMTSAINVMVPVARYRTTFLPFVIGALVGWLRSKPTHLTPMQSKSVERTIKNSLVALYKTSEAIPLQQQIGEALASFNIRSELLQKYREQAKSNKRSAVSAPEETEAGINKPGFGRFVHGLGQMPFPQVVEATIAALQSVPIHRLNEAISSTRIQLGLVQAGDSVPQPMLPPAGPPSLPLPLPPPSTAGAPNISVRDPRLRLPQHARRLGSQSGVIPSDVEASPPMPLPAGGQPTFPIPPYAHSTPGVPVAPYPMAPYPGGHNLGYAVPGSGTYVPPQPPVADLVDDAFSNKPGFVGGASLNEDAEPLRAVPDVSDAYEGTQSSFSQPLVLDAPQSMSADDAKLIKSEAVRRMIECWTHFQPVTNLQNAESSQPMANESRQDNLSAARLGWITLLSRTVARLNGGQELNTPAPDDAGLDESQMDEDGVDQPTPKRQSALADDDPRGILMDFVMEDFKLRYELAAAWLLEEWLQDQKRQGPTTADPATRVYPILFEHMLLSLSETAHGKERVFTKFLIDAPELLLPVVEPVVRCYCEDKESALFGLGVLRDLIILRPAVREWALRTLLDYCVHPNRSLRSNAILVVKRWYPDHAAFSGPIFDKAMEYLQMLHGPAPAPTMLEDEDEDEQRRGEALGETKADDDARRDDALEPPSAPEEEESKCDWIVSDVQRHLELYFALCSKRPELLYDLFEFYSGLPEGIQSHIRSQILPLLKALTPQAAKVIQIFNQMDAQGELVRDLPKGSESLFLRSLIVFTDKELPTMQIVEPAQEIIKRHQLGTKFLIPILPGFPKSEILAQISKVVLLLNETDRQRKLVQSVFCKLCEQKPVGEESPQGSEVKESPEAEAGAPPPPLPPAPLTPAELLIALHNAENIAGLRKLKEAIVDICFQLPNTFTSSVLTQALQSLIEQPQLPTMFMRTLIQYISVSQATSVNSFLAKLVTRKIWTNSKLWEGFVLCCSRTAPSSMTVVIELPRPQLEAIIKAHFIRKALREYILSMPSEISKSDRVQSILKLVNERPAPAQPQPQTQTQAPAPQEAAPPVQQPAQP
ncbi:Symplekin tight junction protein C terminal-domain-containing protein [Polychytrium aggregatum]|uniref:Symplekin tight junction protein C terminal-domain-containing protein n=1 Tax=Polychytrium aggregatum TaxID=110093 RepID=UPI0022FECD75|nr:Symplekin tight junction protein C terminal-domain-containing protein [Polychytrium aggregatum]KAI9203204.1 Symplekin tight junction protein C terminal-domain-containing protein [Polychytrium aggregatum]